MKKKALFLFLMLSTFVVLAPCGGSKEAEEASTDTAAVSQETEGKHLILGIQSDGKTLDPHVATDAASMHLIENMYSTLVRYKEGSYGEIASDLAESYEISEDGLMYTFHLREGAVFHNSSKAVDSSAVKYSIQRIIEKEIRAYQFDALKTIETPDAKTVVITLSKSVAPFITYLAYPMNAIVNPDVAESEGLDFADGGSGPFMLKEWEKDQQCVLIKNPNYYIHGLPKLDSVTYRPIPDETARIIALKNGEVDLLLDITYKDAQQLEKDDQVIIDTMPGTFWEYVGINVEKPPLDDVRVRQAIAYAIHRQEVNDFVKFGRATVLDGGVIPPTHWAYGDVHIYAKQDITKAKRLLSEAGYPEGVNLEMKVGAEFQYQVDAAQIIKQQLAKAGINVNVLAQESGIFFDALGKHDFQLSVVGWLGFIDPDDFFYNIFHTGEPWNQQGYSNARVDTLLEKGREVTDPEERKKIYNELEEIIVTEAPMAFLYMNESITAYRRNVVGFEPNPMLTTLSLRQTDLQ